MGCARAGGLEHRSRVLRYAFVVRARHDGEVDSGHQGGATGRNHALGRTVPYRASTPRGAGGRLKRKRVGGRAENTRMRVLSQRSRHTPQIHVGPNLPNH